MNVYQILTHYSGVRDIAGTDLTEALVRASRWYGPEVLVYYGPKRNARVWTDGL